MQLRTEENACVLLRQRRKLLSQVYAVAYRRKQWYIELEERRFCRGRFAVRKFAEKFRAASPAKRIGFVLAAGWIVWSLMFGGRSGAANGAQTERAYFVTAAAVSLVKVGALYALARLAAALGKKIGRR